MRNYWQETYESRQKRGQTRMKSVSKIARNNFKRSRNNVGTLHRRHK